MKIFQRIQSFTLLSLMVVSAPALKFRIANYCSQRLWKYPNKAWLKQSSNAAKNDTPLFKDMRTEGNDLFILPPIGQRTVIDRVEVEVRYKRVKRMRNKYKDEYVEQERLVPVAKGKYGDITGYQKKKGTRSRQTYHHRPRGV